MARPSRRSSRGQNSDSSPQPPAARSRKRNVKEDSEEEVQEEQQQDEQPRRLKQSRVSSEHGTGGGGSGSGSGSGSRRSSGFQNIQSQIGQEEEEDGEGEGEQYSFSQTQNDARAKMVKLAREPSKEVQIEEKDERKGNELSDTEQKELIKKMMRYLLMKGLNHEPVTRKEMMDDVLGARFRKSGVLKYILTKADQRLQQGMGFKVTTLAAGSRPCVVKDTFYVVNVLDNEDHFRELLKGRGQAGRGLLMLVLSIISCSSDKIASEDQLFKKLHDHVDKRVPEKAWQSNNPKNKNKVHVDGLGDVHDHLATFVKQHYLTKKTVTKPTADGGNENIPFYGMGSRSHLEIGERQILELMAKMTGTTVAETDIVELEEQEAHGPSQMPSQEN